MINSPALPKSAVDPTAEERSYRTRLTLIVFFGLIVLLLGFSGHLLQDPDTFWHIAVGEHLWRSGRFPQVDELSHTFAGAPWIAKEWLSQLILYFAYAIGGWTGVVVLISLTIASSFALLFGWLMRRVKTIIAADIIAIAVLLASNQFSARPHIFFFPLLMLWVGGLICARERGAPPSWWLLPLIGLWANLHASFTIAFVLAGILGLEALAAASAAERTRTAVQWSVFGLGALIATAATPYGYKPLLITFQLFGGNEALQHITEWQPLPVDIYGGIAAVTLVASLGILVMSPRRNLFRILLVLTCGYLMVRYSRFSGLFAIVSAMSIVGPLTQQCPVYRSQAMQLGPRAQASLFAAITALAGTSIALAALARPSPTPQVAPLAAFEAAQKAGAIGPVFNSYDFGGFLIFHKVKTFIDGRSDQLFLNGFMNTVFRAEESDSGVELDALLRKYEVTWALLRANSRTSDKLEQMNGWMKIHQDNVAAVFIKRAIFDTPQRQPW